MPGRAERESALPKRAVSNRGDMNPPSASLQRGDQIEETLLRPAEVTELVEEEDVHPRS